MLRNYQEKLKGMVLIGMITLGGCAASQGYQGQSTQNSPYMANLERQCQQTNDLNSKPCVEWLMRKKQLGAAKSAAMNRPAPNFYLPPLR